MPNPFPWTPDLGDGNFKNPVLFADYSDPDVVRVGDDFYLTASSFNSTPGLPVLHSTDLVNWTIINHALKNNVDPRYADYQGGQGVWAPAIRHHDGRFWIFYPTPDEGIYVVTATDPKGQWSEPHLLLGGKGLIDPCPLWDDDGKAYLVHAYANSRAGIKHKLRVRPMSPDAKTILGDGEIVWDDPVNHPTCEGPKFHKWNGMYYISAPAGGVATGWQLILRSKNPYGPYEPKVVLRQGNTPTNGPHQGAIVDTAAGEWWFLHFQELQPYGRICHLQPMSWKNGWPLMGINHDADDCGEPVLTYKKPKTAKPSPIAVPATSDEFDSEKLGLQWQWNANHRDDWHSLKANKGSLRLFAQINPSLEVLKYPNLLAQKFPAPAFTVNTQLNINPAAVEVRVGLTIAGLKYAEASIVRAADGSASLVYNTNGQPVQKFPLKKPAARLRVEVVDRGFCTFYYSESETGEDFKEVAPPFQATEGHWIGARVGVFAVASGESIEAPSVDVSYFRFA